MGAVMQKLKELWVEEEFKPSKEDLLKHLPKVYNDLNIVDGKFVKKAKTN
jgi:DNA-directed RNA polymerase delta subunit